MSPKYLVAFIWVWILAQGHTASIRGSSNNLRFIILHNNDMHARFEQINRNAGACTQPEMLRSKCFGGFARIANVVRSHREEAKQGGLPVLYMNAGDTYSGTVWFSVFKSNITSRLMNVLQPDVVTLGNHEFDRDIPGLLPFLEAAQFPVLVSNMDTSKEPKLHSLQKLSNSTILTVKGTRIGVIGYLTPKTKEDYVNKLEFHEEVVAVNAEAKKLKDQGINIIIALGHSGYRKDEEIARDCPEVDIVIGGHSHTYLDANQPVADKDDSNPEAVRGPYPTMVVQPNGKRVPVVQAFAYTKYLGKLQVEFDGEGNLLELEGFPMLLDNSVPQEQDILDMLDEYRPIIAALDNQVVGRTRVFLEGGKICRVRECNLGNLITDSMVYARMKEFNGKRYWTDAPIALITGGGIRVSIDNRPDGLITHRNIQEAIPFENQLYMIRMKGTTLRNALERSASLRPTDSNGGFLQFSGMHVVYDFSRPKGQQVVSATVRCARCNIPKYVQLRDTLEYNVIVPHFLTHGGDGYTLVEHDDPQVKPLMVDDLTALKLYLASRTEVYSEMEGRIRIRRP